MGIADRIILTLYTILMTVASVLTLLCSLGVFSDTGMVAFISISRATGFMLSRCDYAAGERTPADHRPGTDGRKLAEAE